MHRFGTSRISALTLSCFLAFSTLSVGSAHADVNAPTLIDGVNDRGSCFISAEITWDRATQQISDGFAVAGDHYAFKTCRRGLQFQFYDVNDQQLGWFNYDLPNTYGYLASGDSSVTTLFDPARAGQSWQYGAVQHYAVSVSSSLPPGVAEQVDRIDVILYKR